MKFQASNKVTTKNKISVLRHLLKKMIFQVLKMMNIRLSNKMDMKLLKMY
jgi:hypothetical protein